MKYKVGDKFRMLNGGIASVEGARCDVYKVIDDGGVNYITGAYISHQIISDITDELIDRFKNEKIAWHFKKKEDYVKVLDILKNKKIEFYSTPTEYSETYFDCYHEFCIRFSIRGNSLFYGDIYHYLSEGFEIIEIMNPIYVPTVIKEMHIMIDGTPYMKIYGSGQYKGIDCELLYQKYCKVISEINLIERMKQDINTLSNRLCTARYENKLLTKENNSLKTDKEKMMKDLDKMTFQLSRIAGILDEDC